MGDTYDGAVEADADQKRHKALRSTRVELEPMGLTEHGRRYRVNYAGDTLVEGRRNPIFDACRAMLARGITGRLEVWRRGKTSADMQLDIERGAGLAICETATVSLRIVPWLPWPSRPDITSQNAVSRRSLQPPAAICASPVGLPTPEPTPAPGVSAMELARKPRSEASLEQNIALGDRQAPDTHPEQTPISGAEIEPVK